MKIVWVLLFGTLILGGSPSYAQKVAHRPMPADGGDTPPPTIPGDNFLGDWEWSDGSEVFHITLERNPNWPVPFSPTHRTANVILGNFRYTRNGTVIAASVRAPASADNGLFYSKIERQKMAMTFYDAAHGKSGWVILTFLPNSNDQITWSLQQVEELHINNTTPPNFSVPTAVTLTRQ